MEKVKTKKEMNLPELIQWGWDNKVKIFRVRGSQNSLVYFDYDSQVHIHTEISPKEVFTVELIKSNEE